MSFGNLTAKLNARFHPHSPWDHMLKEALFDSQTPQILTMAKWPLLHTDQMLRADAVILAEACGVIDVLADFTGPNLI